MTVVLGNFFLVIQTKFTDIGGGSFSCVNLADGSRVSGSQAISQRRSLMQRGLQDNEQGLPESLQALIDDSLKVAEGRRSFEQAEDSTLDGTVLLPQAQANSSEEYIAGAARSLHERQVRTLLPLRPDQGGIILGGRKFVVAAIATYQQWTDSTGAHPPALPDPNTYGPAAFQALGDVAGTTGSLVNTVVFNNLLTNMGAWVSWDTGAVVPGFGAPNITPVEWAVLLFSMADTILDNVARGLPGADSCTVSLFNLGDTAQTLLIFRLSFMLPGVFPETHGQGGLGSCSDV